MQQRLTILGLLVLVAASVYSFFIQYNQFSRPLTWDEVNYACAVQAGIINNAFEQESMSFVQLAEMGIAKVKKIPFNANGFPQEQEDVFVLRHFHHPLPVYYFSMFLNDNIAKQALLLRVSNLLLSFLCAFIFLFIAAKSFSGRIEGTSFLSACLCISVFITSDLFLSSFFEMNFHVFFLPAAAVFAWRLIIFLQQPAKNNATWLGLSGAVVLCVLETSVFIFLGAILAVFLLKQKHRFNGYSKHIAIVFVLSAIILWPGIIKTLGPAKSWAMYAYRIFAMKNVAYEDVSVLANMRNIFSGNIPLFLIIAAGYAKLIFDVLKNKNSDRMILAPGIIGLFYFIVMLPFTLNNTYIFPALGLLFLGSVPGITRLLLTSIKIKYALLLSCLAIVATHFLNTNFEFINNNSVARKEKFQSDMNEVKNLLQYKQPMLMDGGHIVKYYFPGDNEWINSLQRIDARTAQFAIRMNYQYVLQDSLLGKGFYKGILIGKHRNYSPNQFEKLKQWGYKIKELNYYYLFSR